MKKLSLVCPKCGSRNAREWNKGKFHIFDEDTYVFFKAQFGDSADIQNHYMAECICDDCQHHFKTQVILDVSVLDIKYVTA